MEQSPSLKDLDVHVEHKAISRIENGSRVVADYGKKIWHPLFLRTVSTDCIDYQQAKAPGFSSFRKNLHIIYGEALPDALV